MKNILSLFDGISCGQIALNKCKINYENYFASEIDKNAIKITQHNYPKTVQLGNVEDIHGNKLPQIDLLMGGSPCQGFSLSGKQLNFDDKRSKLFFEFVRLLHECKPKYFFLENVIMKKEYQDIISSYLDTYPIKIDSKSFSSQSRRRLYWTNIPNEIFVATEKNILLRDVLENYSGEKISDLEINKQLKQILSTSKYKNTFMWRRDSNNRILVLRPDGLKIQRIGRIGFGSNKSEIITVLTQPYVFDGVNIRKVTPLEAERLQTIPDGYTNIGLSNGIRYRVIGNSWTVDVISHFFKELRENNKEKK